eukprot:259909-Prymnesium_polylepis.1
MGQPVTERSHLPRTVARPYGHRPPIGHSLSTGSGAVYRIIIARPPRLDSVTRIGGGRAETSLNARTR